MSFTESTTLSTTPPGGEAVGRVLRLVSEGYRLLAEIHEAIGEASSDPAEGQQYVAAATRELAAIQQTFERRGRDGSRRS